MLEAPVQDRQGRAAETVERHAHILWIDHGDGGHGYLRGDSRAFSALPLSLTDTGGASSPDTTPGELLAAAQCASFVVTLAGLLAQRRTPALELTVDATCETEGGECGGKIRGLHVCVRGRGAGLESESFIDSANQHLGNHTRLNVATGITDRVRR